MWVIEEAPAIVQGACIMKATKNPAAAERLSGFLGSTEAKAVLEKYGYR